MALDDKKRKEASHHGKTPAQANKRAKTNDARSITTQSTDAALKDGELDLQAFLSAREFEIAALEDGIRRSSSARASRAFQLVPRSLRRRTASHNVKKLPKRLRPRARREQALANTPTVEPRRRKPRTTRARIRVETAKRLGLLAKKKKAKLSKLRREAEKVKATKAGDDGDQAKPVDRSDAIQQLIISRPAKPKIRRNALNEPMKPKAKFRKRQIDKTWLPTHLWHSKRACMTPPKEPLWRFAIPLTPTEKCYRPTHRATTAKGAVVWDVSYMSTIGLYGAAKGVERTLQALGMTHSSLWDHRGQSWRDGQRKWSGMLSKQMGEERRDIGPATVIWSGSNSSTTMQEPPEATQKQIQQTVFIRTHPACFLELFQVLTKLIKREKPRLYIEDLRFEIGSIEFAGPNASEVLSGILKSHPGAGETTQVTLEALKRLAQTEIMSDTVSMLALQDPRLDYPPRPVAKSITATTNAAADTAAGVCSLFDRESRFTASKLPSQKSLNRRKGTLGPGEALPVTPADPAIPVLLFNSRRPGTGAAPEIWTLLAPWKCILPFWYSFVHFPLSTGGNPRFGGLDEMRQVAFEQGQPWFPADFPGTDAGVEWELEQRAKRKASWERRPKSKRISWEALDLGLGRKGEVGLGWACEFERLFEVLPETAVVDAPTVPQETADEPANVDAGTAEAMDVDNSPASAPVESSKMKPPTKIHALHRVNHLSKSAVKTIMTNANKAARPPAKSLFMVKLTCTGRGVPEPCARLYRLPTIQARITTAEPLSTDAEVPATQLPDRSSRLPADLREQWLARLPRRASDAVSSSASCRAAPQRIPPGADLETRKTLLTKTLTSGHILPLTREVDSDDHLPVPDEHDLMGYVTTGSYNLREAKGVAIGCLAADKALGYLGDEHETMGRKQLCIFRNAGEKVGWLARWELV